MAFHGPRFYARDGSEITLEQWSNLLGDDDYKRVALTRFGEGEGEIAISTVWLGLDHHFSFGDGPDVGPVHIFETMVFGGPRNQDQWRYATEAAALDGHAEVVEQVRLAYQLTLPDAVVERPVQVEEES